MPPPVQHVLLSGTLCFDIVPWLLCDQWEAFVRLSSVFHFVTQNSRDSISLLVLKFSTTGKLRITLFHKIATLSCHCLWEVWSWCRFPLRSYRLESGEIDVGHCGNHRVAFIVVFLGPAGPTLGVASHPSVAGLKLEEKGQRSGQIFGPVLAQRRENLGVSLCLSAGVWEKGWLVSLWGHGLWHTWTDLHQTCQSDSPPHKGKSYDWVQKQRTLNYHSTCIFSWGLEMIPW